MEVLRALDDTDLQPPFTQSTINDELRRYVIGRLLRTRNGFAQVTMPSLFQPPDVEWTLPDDPGSDLNRALREAVVRLHNEPDAWADTVATLRAGLAAIAATPGAQVSPSAGYYAATAARVYLRENQPAEAAAVIELGLRSNPLDPELAYLLRVMELAERRAPASGCLAYVAAAPTARLP